MLPMSLDWPFLIEPSVFIIWIFLAITIILTFIIRMPPWSYASWINNYLCNQCLSPITLWVRIPLRRGILDTTLCKNTMFIAVAQKLDTHTREKKLMNPEVTNVKIVLVWSAYGKIRQFSSLAHVAIKKNGVDALVNFNGNFSKICYFRNSRIPGQFTMCENLP